MKKVVLIIIKYRIILIASKHIQHKRPFFQPLVVKEKLIIRIKTHFASEVIMTRLVENGIKVCTS